MEAKLDKFVRIKGYENSEAMTDIRRRITEEVELRFAEEANVLRDENKAFREEELEFRKAGYEIAEYAYKNKSSVKVATQTGRGGTLIREYVGYVESLYESSKCFNFVTKDEYDGKPFTIGMSCLLSIKIL
jgi:hypothetical protein